MKSSATTAFLGNKLHCKSARELQKPRDADTLVQLQVSYYNVSEHICLQDKKTRILVPFAVPDLPQKDNGEKLHQVCYISTCLSMFCKGDEGRTKRPGPSFWTTRQHNENKR